MAVERRGESLAERVLFGHPLVYRIKYFLIETVIWRWVFEGLLRRPVNPVPRLDDLVAGRHVLLAACGPGDVSTGPPLDGAARVSAFDLAPRFVEACRRNRPAWEVFEADILAVPRPARSYDVAALYSSLHHIPADAGLILAELARLARERVIVVEGVLPERGLLACGAAALVSGGRRRGALLYPPGAARGRHAPGPRRRTCHGARSHRPHAAAGARARACPVGVRAVRDGPPGYEVARSRGAMRVGLMKKIDQWAGGFGCFALDVVDLATGWLRRRQVPRERVRAVLVTKYFGMGSIILAAPMVARLRGLFPQARLVFLTFRENRELAERLGLFDEILTIDAQRLGGLVHDTLAALLRLWRLGADVVCDLEFFTRYSTLVAYLSGARTRVGYFSRIAWRGHLLTHPVYYNGTKHITRVFLAQAEALGASVDELAPIVLPGWASIRRPPKARGTPCGQRGHRPGRACWPSTRTPASSASSGAGCPTVSPASSTHCWRRTRTCGRSSSARPPRPSTRRVSWGRAARGSAASRWPAACAWASWPSCCAACRSS